ncbi:MAG: linear amide C-N hydrolase [Firmicutes bacterium]|nr:linear amide C-N hydrolase [Bacillota bacterium]
MKRKISILFLFFIISTIIACSANQQQNTGEYNMNTTNTISEIKLLESGLSTVQFKEDYYFDKYIEQGGASSDKEVIQFLKDNILSNVDIEFQSNTFGCSTISSLGTNKLFGRNFDWNHCNALIMQSKPPTGYASISTVNMDFIQTSAGFLLDLLPDNIKTIAALYAPLDGMNEKGLCVAVNMISDNTTIEQNSNKPDITTTTAIRLLLDKAANVEEAIALLQQYDMHASMGMMVHFAISDVSGKSVAVEYINNEMVVTETPVLTNFYVSEGKKYGIGSAQSHERYDILTKVLFDNDNITTEQMKNALDSVSKDNFNEYEATEWSIIFNQTSGEVTYYHRENYQNGYTFDVKGGD